MLDLLFSSPLVFIVSIIGLIISITIHEFSHALAADRLGDPTPRMQGRLTLNPRAHLDPLGSILMLVTRFGWGKPVQFDPFNLKDPVKGSAAIAIAGPLSNLLLASVLSIIVKTHLFGTSLWSFAVTEVILINIALAVFNLVPIHPLDGGKIILAFLPRNLAIEYEELMHRFGVVLLLALIFPWYQGQSPISFIIGPIMSAFAQILL